MKKSLAMFLILWSLQAKAQIQFNSFQEVLNYADTHAQAIQSAVIGEQMAFAEKKEAKLDLLPTLDGSLGYNDNITLQPTLIPANVFNPEAPEGTFEELTFGTKFNYSYGIQAQWDVLNFQKIFASKTANIAFEQSEIDTERNRYNTYNQLASTYYSILLTQESIRIYNENVLSSTSIYNNAKEKYQEGIIDEAELNRSAIKKLQSQSSLNLAKKNLEQFYIQLQIQLNTKQIITISDTPEKFILADTSIRSIHPEVAWQEAEMEKYESVLKQTKASRSPTISMFYAYNQVYASNDFFNFSDAINLPQQYFGVQISLAGLLQPATQQKINQSKSQVQLQQMQLEHTRLATQHEDHLLQVQFEQAYGIVVENKQILNLQEENDAHAENKYQNGIASLDQRLNEYEDLLNAQDRYLQSLAEFTLAQYKIYIRQINFQAR